MFSAKVSLNNIKSISYLAVDFKFTDSNILVITGKNGVGKTSLVKAFHLVNDPGIFEKSAGLNAIRANSKVRIEIDSFKPFSFEFNTALKVLDTKDKLPELGKIIAELPIPFGERFRQFALIASYDRDIRDNIAATNYKSATELIDFLSQIYAGGKFSALKTTTVGKNEFYFILHSEDYYLREDHFSSGEYFLIQIFRLISSGAQLIIVDEIDVALDALDCIFGRLKMTYLANFRNANFVNIQLIACM